MSSQGSFEMFDAGVNMSMRVNDKLRIFGPRLHSRLRPAGQWHPMLDYGYADYRFKDWFGVRGGKVKTVLGFFNDTQDNESLSTFALLPQSVYPTDLRDATIGHTGGDIYGNVPVKGLLIGASHMREQITGTGAATCSPAVPINCQAWVTAAGAVVPGLSESEGITGHDR